MHISIFVGWFRLRPGPRFWTCVYLFVDFFVKWRIIDVGAFYRATRGDEALAAQRLIEIVVKAGYKGYIGIEYVWIDWEHCNEVDNLAETILFRDGFLTEASASNVWIVHEGALLGPTLALLPEEMRGPWQRQWRNAHPKGTRQRVPALVDVDNPGLTGGVQNQPDFQAGAADHRTRDLAPSPNAIEGRTSKRFADTKRFFYQHADAALVRVHFLDRAVEVRERAVDHAHVVALLELDPRAHLLLDRGAAFGDLDADGDVDVVVSELNGPGVAFECPEQDGLHLWEDAYLAEVVDPATGRSLNASFVDYKMPLAMDMPPIRTILLETAPDPASLVDDPAGRAASRDFSAPSDRDSPACCRAWGSAGN